MLESGGDSSEVSDISSGYSGSKFSEELGELIDMLGEFSISGRLAIKSGDSLALESGEIMCPGSILIIFLDLFILVSILVTARGSFPLRMHFFLARASSSGAA